MKEIDWSKAPEGATHWHDEYDCYVACWVKEQEGQRYYLRADGLGCTWLRDRNPLPIDKCIPRTAAQPAWSGEGLPPAGTVCEVLNNTLDRPEWERCTILFMGKFKAVYESDSCHERVADVSESWMISFRPLRTPEQIAAEERRAAILEMKGNLSFSDYREAEQHCAALYDAGYRRVEQ